MLAHQLLLASLLAVPAAAQLPMRQLGATGDRILLVGGDSLAPVDPLAQGEVLPTFKRCGAPVPPLGTMRGTGTVTYTLLADGTVDTSTITAVEARGMSFPGVESAAVRVLGQCRFKPAKLGGHTIPIKLAQIMKFETEVPGPHGLEITPRVVANPVGTTTMAKLGLGTDSTTVVYGSGSRDLDDAPRFLSCRWTGLPSTPGDMSASLRYVVRPDGSVDSATVGVSVASSRSGASKAEAFARALVTHCSFAPARVLGRPVPAVVEHSITVRHS